MPATMDNLDELSNEQLHLRLLEYGMANMPVTTTTRNVLIKRLRLVIGKANAKTRRETVHVTKFSSGDESESSDAIETKKSKTVSRRATMAPNKATTPPRTTRASATPPRTMRASATPPPEPRTITTRRNSGRITPLANREAPIKLVSVPIEIEEESDTDMIPLTQPPRKLREPSMGKSETVVTSFQHTVSPIIYDVDDDDDDDDEYDNDNAELESSNDVEIHSSAVHYAQPGSTPVHRDLRLEAVTRNVGRSSISTSYNTSYRPTYASTFKSGNIDDEVTTEAPYLSDFTRRLSRLRAEPLVMTPINDEPTQSYAYRPSGRKAACKVSDDSLWRSFVTMLHTFNRQYGGLIVGFLLVFVFILFYVIFIKID